MMLFAARLCTGRQAVPQSNIIRSKVRAKWPAVVLVSSLLAVGFFVLGSNLSSADTLHVCPSGCAYRQIRVALWDAQPGDTIMVGPGTYRESLGLKTGVRVQGAGSDVTFLISEGRPAVVGTGSITATCVLDGFTIIGGAHEPTSRGGAIYIDSGAKQIISHNVISGCVASEKGGGIYVEGPGTAPVIVDNFFVGNTVQHVGGGAIYVQDAAPVIERNTFIGNLADKDGGALAVYTTGVPIPQAVVANNVFISNSALAKGGAIYLQGASPEIRANHILSNTALSGAGIHANDHCSARVEGNLIAYNVTIGAGDDSAGGGLAIVGGSNAWVNRNIIRQNGAARGDGVYIDNASPDVTNNVIVDNGSANLVLTTASPHIVNNTILGSSCRGTTGIDLFGSSQPRVVNNIIAFEGYGIRGDGEAAPIILYNDLWMNLQADSSGVQAGATNLSADPCLVDAANGDYHLTSNSLLIDAGSTQNAPIDDFDGDIRPVDGDGDSVAAADIGADEFVAPAPATPTSTATPTGTLTPTPTITPLLTGTPTITGTPTSPAVHIYLPIVWAR